jgi:hypothetical protein
VFDWPVAVTTWPDGSPQIVPLRVGEIPPAAPTKEESRAMFPKEVL